MDASPIAVSIGLQYGVPPETYVSKFTNLRSEPAGLTDDPDAPMSQSLMEYDFRRLALDYLHFEARSALASTPPMSASATSRPLLRADGGTGSAAELIETPVGVRTAALCHRGRGRGGRHRHHRQGPQRPQTRTSAELLEQITGQTVDSPLCMTCGTKMRRAGSCDVCEGCESPGGCS